MSSRRRRRVAPLRSAIDVLVLDVGNSKTQGVLLHDGEERFRWRVDYADGDARWSRQTRSALRAARHLAGARIPVYIVSVAPKRAAVVERQARALGWRPVRRLSHRDTWPFRIGVQRLESLGVDRLANVAGLVALGLRRAVAIDAGTAITVDVLRGGAHAGGLILPGARLWSAALHAYTAQLPESGWHDDAALIGHDTQAALRAGLRHGLAGAVRGIVAALRSELGVGCAVVFTGGDGLRLHEACALRAARLEPDLLVRGVLRLLRDAH